MVAPGRHAGYKGGSKVITVVLLLANIISAAALTTTLTTAADLGHASNGTAIPMRSLQQNLVTESKPIIEVPYSSKMRLGNFKRQPGRLSLLSFFENLLAGPAGKSSAETVDTISTTTTAQAVFQSASVTATAADVPAQAMAAATTETTTSRDWPLTDEEIESINQAFAASASAEGAYQFETGLPPLPALLTLDNSTAEQYTNTLSGDRIHQLAVEPQNHGYIMRTFVVSGDALLKLHLTRDLQLVIRDIISESVEQATSVPADQVLMFAASNISISLGFKGVAFPSTDRQDTTETNQGLAAVRDALSQLAGDFDPKHIAVSFAALPAPSESTASLNVQQGRRLLATTQQQQQEVVVYARFYNVDPANVTALIGALGSVCGPPAAAYNGSAAAAWSSLAAGKQLSPICASVFTAEFAQHGIPLAFGDMAVMSVDKPQANVALSVAVGLSEVETHNTSLVDRASSWLNSTALHDILDDLNLTAQTLPTDFLSYLSSGQNREPGSGLSLPGLLGMLGGSANSASRPDQQAVSKAAPGSTAVVSKGMIAGITIAAVTSVMALVGVAVLLVLRRPQADKLVGKRDGLPTTHEDDTQRRRRRRPRMYHTKFLPTSDPPPLTASGQPDQHHQVSSQPDYQDRDHQQCLLPTVLPRPALQRGDSVTSAVQFEQDGAVRSESDVGDGTALQQQVTGSSSGSEQGGEDRAESSSSSSNSWTALVKPSSAAIELQPMRASGVHRVLSCGSDSGLVNGEYVDPMICDSINICSGSSSAAAAASWQLGTAHQISEESVHPKIRSSGFVQERQQQQQQHSQQQQPPASTSSTVQPALQVSSSQPIEACSVDAAAAFAAMGAQLELASKDRCRDNVASAAVQPLGLSCWHYDHQQHVIADSATASSTRGGLAALPHEQLQLQQWQREQYEKQTVVAISPFAAAASPFAAEQEQAPQDCSCSSSSQGAGVIQ